MAIPTPITLGDNKPVEKEYNFDHGKVVDLTTDAVEKVKNFTQKNAEQTKGKLFRILVEGGGCNGFQYQFTFDHKKDKDYVIPCADIEVLLDKNSEPFIKGAVVDYVENSTGAGFIVKNPQAKAECGCGISFSV